MIPADIFNSKLTWIIMWAIWIYFVSLTMEFIVIFVLVVVSVFLVYKFSYEDALKNIELIFRARKKKESFKSKLSKRLSGIKLVMESLIGAFGIITFVLVVYLLFSTENLTYIELSLYLGYCVSFLYTICSTSFLLHGLLKNKLDLISMLIKR